MPVQRTSQSQRIKLQNVAERAVMQYAGDHAAWHKHVHNVELDAAQTLKMIEMDENPFTIDFSCRRTGKTAGKSMYQLEYNATNADQELGIVAPREAQALVNLRYHLDAIRRSPILQNYISYERGRLQMSDTYYKFANRSVSRAYGIMAQVDGGDLTHADLEEVDDMPYDRLYSRFLLMMGSNRRMGASKASENKPQIRITGVFKGGDALQSLLDSGDYYKLMTVDCHLAVQLGIMNQEFIEMMKSGLSPAEYIRQLLCINVSARNLIWDKWLHSAVVRGVKAGIEIEIPEVDHTYKKRGLVSFGYDASGHGESPEASKHAFIVTEQIGNFVCFLFARVWPAGADETTVKNDLKSYWRYFMPDTAHGDAFGIGMMTQLCDELFRESLTTVDRRAIGEGESTQGTWQEWPFSPLRFEGMLKHQMATALSQIFSNGYAVLPLTDELAEDEESVAMNMLKSQLTNIVGKPTSKSYSSYKMVNKKIGDDLFDAAMASVWGIVTRMMGSAPTKVLVGHRKRMGEDNARYQNA